MDITEVSMIHHVAIVLLVLWCLNSFNCCHPISYCMSLIYLFLVHERYVMRLRKKLQFDERKQANQRRVLCDSETVRWLNHAVEKMWPICIEQIVSQKILLPIIPWFLDKYKPWTAKQAVIQQLYLGRNPPMFTEMRVLRDSSDDDHLVMELCMNFLTADDMSCVLAVQLRKRLGFGMWAKLHMTGMHIEGKILIGLKFLRHWPFLGRLRLCFVEPPYVQMTVKPLFNHGIDVTELPGIAGWLDNLLSIAFEQTLVEPNMLVADLEKFVSPQSEKWFSVDEKEPAAFVNVEVIEAAEIKPSDLNGLADPYVKGQMGPYRFRTKTQKKTLFPKWQEEFKIPICSWESPNILAIEVCDKDHFVDDILGDCSVNICDLRDGQRHNMWLPLQNVKTGRLRLAITVLDNSGKVPMSPEEEEEEDDPYDEETIHPEEKRNDFASETVNKGSLSYVPSEKSPTVADNFEPINIEGQKGTGIWVQQPGSEVSQTWEPRKGKSRHNDNQIHGEPNIFASETKSAAPGSTNNDNSSADESSEGNRCSMAKVRRGIQMINSVFQKSPRKEDDSGSIGEGFMSPRPNLRAVNTKNIGARFVVEDSLSGHPSAKVASSEGNGSESPSKQHVKVMARNILQHAGKSARSLKQVLSRKGSRKGGSFVPSARDICTESGFSDEDHSLNPPVERTPGASNPTYSRSDSQNYKDQIAQAGSSNPALHNEVKITKNANLDSLDMKHGNIAKSPYRYDDGFAMESPKQENLGRKDTNFT